MSATQRPARVSVMQDAGECGSASGSSSDAEGEEAPPAPPLDERWARELLRLQDSETVEVRVEEGAGRMSRVRVRAGGGTRALVVKRPPRDALARLFLAEAQFDSREILFYSKVVPEIEKLEAEKLGAKAKPLFVPRCLHVALPEEIGGDSELVLEDVCALGFRPADFGEGLSARQAAAALRAVARLHANSLALRHHNSQTLDKHFDFLFPSDRAAAGYLRLARRGLPRLETFLRAQMNYEAEADAIATLGTRAPALLAALLKPEEPTVLTHADFWSGNLMFRETDGECECVALDWQMLSLGKPMDDVALLMLSSLSGPLRRSEGDRLISEYGEFLEEHCEVLGVGRVGAEARGGLASDRARGELRALLLCAGSVDAVLGEPQAERRLLDAAIDLHASGVLALTPERLTAPPSPTTPTAHA